MTSIQRSRARRRRARPIGVYACAEVYRGLMLACGTCGAGVAEGNAGCPRCEPARERSGRSRSDRVGLVMAGTFGYGMVVVITGWMAWIGAVGWGWIAAAAVLLAGWVIGGAVASSRRRGSVR